MRRLLLGFALLLLAIGQAGAHALNFMVAFVTVEPGVVYVNLTINGEDVNVIAGRRVMVLETAMVDPDLLRVTAEVVTRYVADRSRVAIDGRECALAAIAAEADSDGGIEVPMRFDCPDGLEVTYRSDVLFDRVPAARLSVIRHVGADSRDIGLIGAADREINLTAAPSLAAVFVRYIAYGVEHIFLGYDHVAFLVAVLLWARRAAPVVAAVTAFTVAHSMTLSLAALGWVVISPTIVEPAIALTIVAVAAENFWRREMRGRWRWTFALGLIHGFGFAGALAELGLPRSSLLPALAAFNLGVEAGQLAIVGLLLPLLWLADRLTDGRRDPRLVLGCSAVIGLLGAAWFALRVI